MESVAAQEFTNFDWLRWLEPFEAYYEELSETSPEHLKVKCLPQP
jgi:hypothetical protein